MKLIGESAIRARDFAGFVPASRDAHCRPLHPRLASLCFLGKKHNIDPRLCRRLGLGRSDINRQRPQMDRRCLKPEAAHRRRQPRDTHCYVPICYDHQLLEELPRRGRGYLRPPICPATFVDTPSRP